MCGMWWMLVKDGVQCSGWSWFEFRFNCVIVKVHVVSARPLLNPRLILTGGLVLPVLGQGLSLWQQQQLRTMWRPSVRLLKIHNRLAEISGIQCRDAAYITEVIGAVQLQHRPTYICICDNITAQSHKTSQLVVNIVLSLFPDNC